MSISLPYGPNDLEEAAEFIGRIINSRQPNERTWEALLSPERAEQTHAALVRMEEHVRSQLTHINKNLTEAKYQLERRDISHEEYLELKVQIVDRRARAGRFRREVFNRLQQSGPARKAARVAVAESQNKQMVNVLAALTEAVSRHRATVEQEFEPTTADRLLWARLDLMRLPNGDPLLDLIKRREAS